MLDWKKFYVRQIVYFPKIDIPGIVVAFETELSVLDWLVAEFSPKPIATAASAAVTHMTARRIGVSCPCKSKLESNRTFRRRCVSYFTLRIIIILMETIKNLYPDSPAGAPRRTTL